MLQVTVCIFISYSVTVTIAYKILEPATHSHYIISLANHGVAAIAMADNLMQQELRQRPAAGVCVFATPPIRQTFDLPEIA